MFEWDEAKRLGNLEKHGLDFLDSQAIFDGRPALHAPSIASEEPRFASIAELNGKFHTVVWTWRGENRRIISFRRARVGEERAYRQIYG